MQPSPSRTVPRSAISGLGCRSGGNSAVMQAVAEAHRAAIGDLGLGLPQRREVGGDAAVAEAHRAAIGDLGLGLPQRREAGGDAAVAEPHRAAIGDLGLGLPQRREAGGDAAVAEPDGAAIGDLGLGLPQRREGEVIDPRVSRSVEFISSLPRLNVGQNCPR